MIVLRSRRLALTMDHPGERYQGSRYDGSSFVHSLILDGRHQFLGVESLNPETGDGGMGLCGEFSMESPPGYEDTPVGSDFIKMGVGLAKRLSEDDYCFYETGACTPIDWEGSTSEDSATFICEQSPLRGFAYRLRKHLSLSENRLCADYHLENCGERDIHTQEYCHNFLAFNGDAVGPAHSLTVDYDTGYNNRREGLSCRDRTFTFAPQDDRPFFYEDRRHCRGRHVSWTLNHKALGLSVTEVLSRPISKFAIYGNHHVICPELFADIHAPAGTSFSWQRQWTFESGAPGPLSP